MQEMVRIWSKNAHTISKSKLGSELDGKDLVGTVLPQPRCSSWPKLEHMRTLPILAGTPPMMVCGQSALDEHGSSSTKSETLVGYEARRKCIYLIR